MKKHLVILSLGLLILGMLFIASGVFSHRASQDYLEAAQKWEKAGNIPNSNMCIAVADSHSATSNFNVAIGIVFIVIALGTTGWSLKERGNNAAP